LPRQKKKSTHINRINIIKTKEDITTSRFSELSIEGKIQTEIRNGIHGLTVELVDTKCEYTNRLGQTLTDVNGRFALTYKNDEFAELFTTKPSVFIRVLDQWNNIIYTSKKLIDWKPIHLKINLTLNSTDLQEHLRVPITLERLTGPLIPVEHWKEIAAAISMIASPAEVLYHTYMQVTKYLAPDLTPFQTLVEDAFDVLQGNIDALERFTSSLILLENMDLDNIPKTLQLPNRNTVPYGFTFAADDNKLTVDNEPHHDDELATIQRWHTELREYMQEFSSDHHTRSMIPKDRLALVFLAAAYAGSLEPGGADRYLNILNKELTYLGKLDIVLSASHNAMSGDTQSLKYFQSILEQLRIEYARREELPPMPKPKNPPIPWPPRPGFDLAKIPPREIQKLHCMLEARLNIAQLGLLEIRYHITTIQPLAACPGSIITITGYGFGSNSETVSFPQVNSGQLNVNAITWTDSKIEVEVPSGATCGNLQLLIPAGTVKTCNGVIDLKKRGSGVTYFDGSKAEIQSFTANGKTLSVRADPGENITLAWSICPTTNSTASLKVRAGGGTILYSQLLLSATGTFSFNVPNYDFVNELECELTASNPCTSAVGVASVIKILVAKIPVLKIEGLEITQGIQTFWRQGITSNSLPTIANKDTIVRVYVSADLGGFNNDEVDEVTGTLKVDGLKLHPRNGITPTNPSGSNPFIKARKVSKIDRKETNHTLNFRIPAVWSNGTRNLVVNIIGPDLAGSRQTVSETKSWTWKVVSPFRVRWIRIRDDRPQPQGTGNIPTDDEARFTVQRAFDLIPSPATDIAPLSSTPIFSTALEFVTDAGGITLKNQIQNLHTQADTLDSTGTNIRWIGLTVPLFRGWADGSACITPIYRQSSGAGPPERTRAAHELFHSLGLPHNNTILSDVPFDPFWNQTIDSGTVYDVMSYSQPKWVSEDSWNALQTQVESVKS
jgi:IPT/TIG domain